LNSKTLIILTLVPSIKGGGTFGSGTFGNCGQNQSLQILIEHLYRLLLQDLLFDILIQLWIYF